MEAALESKSTRWTWLSGGAQKHAGKDRTDPRGELYRGDACGTGQTKGEMQEMLVEHPCTLRLPFRLGRIAPADHFIRGSISTDWEPPVYGY